MDLLIKKVRKTAYEQVIKSWIDSRESNEVRVFNCDIHNLIRIAVESTLIPEEVGYLFCMKSKPAGVVVPAGATCLSIIEIVKITKYVKRAQRRLWLEQLDRLDGFDNGLPF